MLLLQLTLDSLAENLALDEALLVAAECGELSAEVLRIWEPRTFGVVLGRSSSAEVEVDLAACRRDRVPVLRRASGGGTVVTGPGCLMYGLVLSLEEFPYLEAIDAAHRWILTRQAQLLAPLCESAQIAGISDLAFDERESSPPRKFSGNAMRRKRTHVLYHGTLLYDFDLTRLGHWLATPTRTPDYRDDRTHGQFVRNLPVAREQLLAALTSGWAAKEELPDWPQQRTTEIATAKYTGNPKWSIHLPTDETSN